MSRNLKEVFLLIKTSFFLKAFFPTGFCDLFCKIDYILSPSYSQRVPPVLLRHNCFYFSIGAFFDFEVVSE